MASLSFIPLSPTTSCFRIYKMLSDRSHTGSRLALRNRMNRVHHTRGTARAQLESQTPQLNEAPPENDSQLLDSDTTPVEADPALSEDDTWFALAQPIAKPDCGQPPPQTRTGIKDGVVDLLTIENAGRQVLAVGSYESVVDVDVDQGGVFEDDEDNNHLLSGVGFDALVESPTILENLSNDFGVATTTHVQLAAIPRILDGRDLVMQSYTGTGKTLAFLLPILDEIDTTMESTQAIIVAPTRELAMQISRECDRLIANTGIRNLPLIGGANPARQVEKLRKGGVPHIVVGTPGRLAELAEGGDLRIRQIDTMVVDEVDQCLVGEFGEQVQRLLRSVPKSAQKVLVSATGDVNLVRKFAGAYMDEPVLLRVVGALRVPQNLSHWMCVVPSRLKIDTVRKILFAEPKPDRAIVFVDEPRRVDIVAERLWEMGVTVGALKGTAHKIDRKETLDAFRKGRVQVLVSTEVAARGLDVTEMTHVINLDLPTDSDHYVHRAGRCGRAGKQGTVVSIASTETAFVLRKMSKEIGVEIRRMEVRGGEYREPLDRPVNTQQRRKESEKAKVITPEPSRPSTETSKNPKDVRSDEKVKPKQKIKSTSKSKTRKVRKADLQPKSPSELSQLAKKRGWVGNR